jgi:hypothetical protein
VDNEKLLNNTLWGNCPNATDNRKFWCTCPAGNCAENLKIDHCVKRPPDGHILISMPMKAVFG